MAAWGVMNWLPTYLIEGRHFGVDKMGYFAAAANLCGALGYPLGGYICDRFFGDRLRIPIALALLVSGVFVYLAARAETGEWAAACLAMALFSTTWRSRVSSCYPSSLSQRMPWAVQLES